MGDAIVKLKTIADLQNENARFFIDAYQRGYRWTENEVRDLLDDIREFMLKQNGEINAERAQIIKEFTELKVVPRQVNTIEGAITVFGLQYKDNQSWDSRSPDQCCLESVRV